MGLAASNYMDWDEKKCDSPKENQGLLSEVEGIDTKQTGERRGQILTFMHMPITS